MAKITFRATIVADISSPTAEMAKYNETSIDHLRELLKADKCTIEYVGPSYSGEPTLIITERQ